MSQSPAASERLQMRFLVAEHEARRWVFPVDGVDGVHRIPAAAMTNLPHTVERSPRSYSQAVFSHDGKKVGLLSETRLFQALEKTVR